MGFQEQTSLVQMRNLAVGWINIIQHLKMLQSLDQGSSVLGVGTEWLFLAQV